MSGVAFSAGVDGVEAADLSGFFEGWPDPPTDDERLEILRAADEVVIARDPGGRVVGFATAITDGRFAAYIPLVEVLPAYRGAGVGSRLVEQLLDRLGRCYMVDLVCDPDVVPFYDRLGAIRIAGMAWRRPDRLHPLR